MDPKLKKEKPHASRRYSLAMVYFTVFIDLLGFGIIMPLLPFYAEKFGATGLWVGLIMAAYSGAQFIGASFLGRLSDRVGRKPVLLICLAGTSLSMFFMGFADSLLILLVTRLAGGLFAGSIATAQAYISDVTRPSERARFMGYIGAAFGMGFVFGPAFGAWLAGYGFGAACYFAAGLAAANLVSASFLLRESRDFGSDAPQRTRLTWKRMADVLAAPTVGVILSAMFFHMLAFTSMHATYILLGESHYHLNPRGMGFIYTFIGLIIVVVQGGLVGRLAARFGEKMLAAAGAALMALGMALVPYMPSIAWSLVALTILSTGNGLVIPTLASLLSKESGPNEQGGVLGFGQSLQALARAVGPIGAGWLYDRHHGAPYLIAGIILLLVSMMIWRSHIGRARETVVAEAG